MIGQVLHKNIWTFINETINTEDDNVANVNIGTLLVDGLDKIVLLAS